MTGKFKLITPYLRFYQMCSVKMIQIIRFLYTYKKKLLKNNFIDETEKILILEYFSFFTITEFYSLFRVSIHATVL